MAARARGVWAEPPSVTLWLSPCHENFRRPRLGLRARTPKTAQVESRDGERLHTARMRRDQSVRARYDTVVLLVVLEINEQAPSAAAQPSSTGASRALAR
eukprot:4583301-Prymnesium_polylepis.2